MSVPHNQSGFAKEPGFHDMMCSLQAVSKQPKGVLKEIRHVIGIARKFKKEVIEPNQLTLDEKLHAEPGHVPMEIIEEANRRGFYTMWMPKLFGGKGYCFPSMCHFVEEIASGCVGIGNLIGVHYLGLSSMIASWNIPLIHKITKEVVEGERRQKPCLISFAMTEPSSGTDTAETDLLDKGKVTCFAERVEGGYKVNGTKIFISNGPVSTYHMLIAFSDLERPSESGVFMMVKTGTKGFTVGKKENKMGQKACPVTELVFKDCFIPDEYVCIDPQQMNGLSRGSRHTYQQILDFVVSVTRPAVCAFGTGIARHAFNEALEYAYETRVNGSLLINHEWAQTIFAEMYKNIATSRLIYMESNYANGLFGFYKALQAKPAYYMVKASPGWLIKILLAPLMKGKLGTKIFRKMQLEDYTEEEMNNITLWSSLAKVAGSDAGIKNCQLALDIMGRAGIRHNGKVEKLLRDSKLLQIYEGTNQMNRLVLFRSVCMDSLPKAEVFDESIQWEKN